MSYSTKCCLLILLALHGLTRAQAAITVIGSDGIVPGTASSDVLVGSYIRSDAPGDSKPNHFLLVGELNANRGSVRGVLSFDLGAIPPGATINSVTLSLYQDRAPAGSGAFRCGRYRTVLHERGRRTWRDLEQFSPAGLIPYSPPYRGTPG